MGLDISHDAWRGAYSAFSRWRHGLAEAAGYAVWPVKYEDGTTSETVILDWGHLQQQTDPHLHGQWTTEPEDPLVYLIMHSDCDGELSPERSARLADRLEELLPLLPTEPAPGHIGDWRAKTQKFIDGAREAAAAGEPLEFY